MDLALAFSAPFKPESVLAKSLFLALYDSRWQQQLSLIHNLLQAPILLGTP